MNNCIRSVANLDDNQLEVVSGSTASISDETRTTEAKPDVAYECELETEEEIVKRLVKVQIYKDCKSFDDILETQRKNLEETMASYGGKQNEGKICRITSNYIKFFVCLHGGHHISLVFENTT